MCTYIFTIFKYFVTLQHSDAQGILVNVDDCGMAKGAGKVEAYAMHMKLEQVQMPLKFGLHIFL